MRPTLTGHMQHEHTEGLFRSLHVVLLDNATAEYSFILAFFTTTATPPTPSASFARRQSTVTLEPSPLSPSIPFSPLEETLSDIGGITPTARRFSINLHELTTQGKDEKTALDAIWKSVLDPAVEYCQVRSCRLVNLVTFSPNRVML